MSHTKHGVSQNIPAWHRSPSRPRSRHPTPTGSPITYVDLAPDDGFLGCDNGSVDDTAEAMIVAVPLDAVAQLESEGLAFPVPVIRGAALDAVVTVGTDAAALVSLLQAPDAIRAFAAWVRDRCSRPRDSIEITARSGDRRIRLRVDGRTDAGVIADLLRATMEGDDIKG